MVLPARGEGRAMDEDSDAKGNASVRARHRVEGSIASLRALSQACCQRKEKPSGYNCRSAGVARLRLGDRQGSASAVANDRRRTSLIGHTHPAINSYPK